MNIEKLKGLFLNNITDDILNHVYDVIKDETQEDILFENGIILFNGHEISKEFVADVAARYYLDEENTFDETGDVIYYALTDMLPDELQYLWEGIE